MAGGGKAGHVEADLGDDDAGDGIADAGHGHESVDGGLKGREGVRPGAPPPRARRSRGRRCAPGAGAAGSDDAA